MLLAVTLIGSTGVSAGTLQPKIEQQDVYLPAVLNKSCYTLRTQTTFGVQMYGATSSGVKTFPSLIESGTSWVRVEVNWKDIEPNNTTPANYSFSSTDSHLAAAKDGCMNMVATVLRAPSWAATSTDGVIDKVAMSEFAELVGALAERYDGDGVNDAPGSPVVNFWELYNEPDGSPLPNRKTWGGDPAKYAEMLKAAYPAIKAANPNAQVLFGGIAYDDFSDQGGHFERLFLDNVLQAGGGSYFDIMNFHVYPFFATNWTGQDWKKTPGLTEKTNAVRAKLAQFGLNKPIFITEAGWHSNSDNEYVPGSHAIQTRYVIQLFTQSMASNVGFMSWFSLVDPGAFYPFQNGLLTVDSPPVRKPAYTAYQIMAREFASAQYQRTLPSTETGSADLKVYQFRDNLKKRTLYVAWYETLDDAASRSLRLPAGAATIYDPYWSPTAVNDSSDGKADGRITMQVGRQPIYIEVKD